MRGSWLTSAKSMVSVGVNSGSGFDGVWVSVGAGVSVMISGVEVGSGAGVIWIIPSSTNA